MTQPTGRPGAPGQPPRGSAAVVAAAAPAAAASPPPSWQQPPQPGSAAASPWQQPPQQPMPPVAPPPPAPPPSLDGQPHLDRARRRAGRICLRGHPQPVDRLHHRLPSSSASSGWSCRRITLAIFGNKVQNLTERLDPLGAAVRGPVVRHRRRVLLVHVDEDARDRGHEAAGHADRPRGRRPDHRRQPGDHPHRGDVRARVRGGRPERLRARLRASSRTWWRSSGSCALLYTTAKSPTKQGLHDQYAHTMVVKATRRAA